MSQVAVEVAVIGDQKAKLVVAEAVETVKVFFGSKRERDTYRNKIFFALQRSGKYESKMYKGKMGLLVSKPVSALEALGFTVNYTIISRLFAVKAYSHNGETYGSSIMVWQCKGVS